jgi:uncharacterized protein YydD (DUF2326 family)
MSIKTWQERLEEKADCQIITTAALNCAMLDEIDELRAALAERDAEIGDLPQAQADMLATIKSQRRVLEQAKDAINDITSHINMKRFWRDSDEKRLDEITDAAITAIQEQLK